MAILQAYQAEVLKEMNEGDGVTRGGRKNVFSDASQFIYFFSQMARVHARDMAGFIAQNLRYEIRAHCLTVCASTHHVLL